MRAWREPFLWGLGGALGAFLGVVLIWGGLIVWTRARNGQAAYECLQSAPCRAQLVK